MGYLSDLLEKYGPASGDATGEAALAAPAVAAPAQASAPIMQAPVQEAPSSSPKEDYIATQYAPPRNIVAPQPGNFDESPQQRADRLAREDALNNRLSAAKTDYEKSLKDASDRQFKAEIFASIGNYLPQAIAGATAMNTKAAVSAPKLPTIEVKDEKDAVDKKYKTEYEKILNQYKQLKSGDMTAAQRANLQKGYDQMGILAQIAGGNAEQRSISSKNAEEERFEKKVDNFGKATENNAQAYNALGTYDKILAESKIPNIDDLTVKDGKVYDKSNKEVDLPGVSIPGIGRVNAHNEKAQTLESAMSKIFNTELKDRSGAAVTSNELERLRLEFGQGKYNTEAQMIKALQEYKKYAHMALKNTEARYEKPIVEEYKQRGGITSDNFAPKGASAPSDSNTKVINGATYVRVNGGWQKAK